MMAACHGHKDCVEALLEAGCDQNQTTELGWTALMDAAHLGHTGVVAALLLAGCDKDCRGKAGETALINAAHGPGARPHAGRQARPRTGKKVPRRKSPVGVFLGGLLIVL